MKKLGLSIAISLLCIFTMNLAFAKNDAEALDRIVAIVNDDIITQSELNHAVAITKLQTAQAQNSPTEELKKRILTQLINKKLQLQLAKQANISITNEDLDHTLQNIAKQNNVSVTQLYQHVNQQGIPTDMYRQEMHEQLTLQKLQQQEVVTHISVTSNEIDQFMKSKKWQDNGPKEYQLKDYLFPLNDNSSQTAISQARAQADKTLQALNQNQPIDPMHSSFQKNDLGWRKLDEIPSAFVSTVEQLQANQSAGPIQTSNGFHIIQLVAVHSLGNSGAPDRKQIENFLMQQKFSAAATTWLEKLRNQAYIKITL